MEFRVYCIVIMGNTENVLPEIVKISEMEPNSLTAGGIIIATFSSVADPRELTEYFKGNGRNFLLFDLNSENSGYNIFKKEINDGLFGFMKNMDQNMLKQRSEELRHVISSTTITNKTRKLGDKKQLNEPQVSIDSIDNMSPDEKDKLIDIFIDKIRENGEQILSEYDREILKKLAN